MGNPLKLTPILRKIVFATGICFLPLTGFAQKTVGGLSVTYSSGGKSSTISAQSVRLYVSAGQSPTPFLPAGKFSAVWNGFITTDLRGDYSFQAELNGELKLAINGVPVLEVAGTNSVPPLSKSIRLSKGTNLFTATFTAPSNGDAFVRLSWQPKGSFAQPIPARAFVHFVSPEEKIGVSLLRGRELFAEHRCGKCHAGPERGMAELSMDAPSFENIGSRLNSEWMKQWIANPNSLRANAQMPKTLHGTNSASEAEDIAAYLTSLQAVEANAMLAIAGDQAVGKKLYETLFCNACHNDPASQEQDIKRISLKKVALKFKPGMLAEFLKKPNAHYRWTGMPEYKLSDAQRESLAVYLLSKSDQPTLRRTPATPEKINHGKTLVQTSGCLNCHSHKLENQFSTRASKEIAKWNAGCLTHEPYDRSKAPQFDFSIEDRDALLSFTATDRDSLFRHVPAEFAERQARNLDCSECHEKIEGVPQFGILGGKFKPEWSAKFIAGEIPDKPRPWIDAQMPAFPQQAELLAEGMAMQHGISPRTPTEPTPDAEIAQVGRNLISAPPLGFSCISCHAVGQTGAAQVFESPGLNLAHSSERLLPEFFKRWLRNPASIDPLTKMPTYFDDEGNSPITDVYEGNGEKQIEAMWHYIRLGEKMPAPVME